MEIHIGLTHQNTKEKVAEIYNSRRYISSHDVNLDVFLKLSLVLQLDCLKYGIPCEKDSVQYTITAVKTIIDSSKTSTAVRNFLLGLINKEELSIKELLQLGEAVSAMEPKDLFIRFLSGRIRDLYQTQKHQENIQLKNFMQLYEFIDILEDYKLVRQIVSNIIDFESSKAA